LKVTRMAMLVTGMEHVRLCQEKKICAMVAGLGWSPRFRSMNRQNINTPGKNKTETKP